MMRSSQRFRVSVGWLLLSVAMSVQCAQEKPKPISQPPLITDLAKVNDETITSYELDLFLKEEAVNGQNQSARRAGLSRLIRQKVIAQEARRAGFSATEQEAREFGWTPPQVEDPDIEDFSLLRVIDYLVIQEFLANRIQAEEEISLRRLLQHYEVNQAEYQTESQRRVLEILVQNRQAAEALRKELTQGDFRQFRDQASRLSTGVGAEWGGDLGLFKRGELPPRFEEVIFALKVGEVSQAFQSELGYHLFTIEELIPRHAQKFYEVQEQIFEEMVSEKERQELDKLVNQMMESASIEILDPNLERDWRKSDGQLP